MKESIKIEILLVMLFATVTGRLWAAASEVKMRLSRTRLLMLGALVTLLLNAALLGQLTVDATGPTPKRHREAGKGHGGGFGRNLPLQVAIEIPGTPPDEDGKTVVEFILTNTGKNDLTVPVSPHPGDLEPSDPKAGYTMQWLGLRITFGKEAGTILPGGADLSGRQAFPETLIALAPGESIRVRTRVALPQIPIPGAGAGVFVGDAILSRETIKIVDGKVLSDMQNIGSARSPEYSPQSLYGSSR